MFFFFTYCYYVLRKGTLLQMKYSIVNRRIEKYTIMIMSHLFLIIKLKTLQTMVGNVSRKKNMHVQINEYLSNAKT